MEQDVKFTRKGLVIGPGVIVGCIIALAVWLHSQLTWLREHSCRCGHPSPYANYNAPEPTALHGNRESLPRPLPPKEHRAHLEN
jgi:hypothetical protein